MGSKHSWCVVGLLGAGVCMSVVAHARPVDVAAPGWPNGRWTQIPMQDPPAPDPTAAEPAPSPGNAPSQRAGGQGMEGSSRHSAVAAQAGQPGPPTAADPDVERIGVKEPLLSFGLMLGQPSGLSVQARLWKRNALVGSVGWDFFYRSLTWSADYRFTVFSWDSLRYDTSVGLFVGGGVRLGSFEPVKTYLRQTPFAVGLRTPVGLTVQMRPLPLELALVGSPLGLDVKEVALVFPRLRPELALELKVHFPFAPW